MECKTPRKWQDSKKKEEHEDHRVWDVKRKVGSSTINGFHMKFMKQAKIFTRILQSLNLFSSLPPSTFSDK
ncbi:hypothetical protein V6N12_050718 [Hibiscus sabdariffa]|uniref:Uncharacterized protein n=1 Tax=Hibiscus sabdariffa TaxID=183260 RepID=A0ABR2GDU5_9ROSI